MRLGIAYCLFSAAAALTLSACSSERSSKPSVAKIAPPGRCQSDANRSPFDRVLPTRRLAQAMRFCHSANAAERRVL